MNVSTLSDLIEAAGGELHISATFADRSVEVSNSKGSSIKTGLNPRRSPLIVTPYRR
jgi:hypothetical protein